MKKLLAYMQLLRLPNVFTAMADIFMGFLISHGSLEPWPEFVALLAASCCIYLAGMALNDWFDIEVDRVERPDRPLPSGRVPRSHALVAGVVLLAAGLVISLTVGGASRNVALILVVAVLAYDGLLKNTPFGPAVMGLCRALNVLLGMSGVPNAIWVPIVQADFPQAFKLGTMAAAGLGLYIMGVTRFARSEATGVALNPISTTIGFNLGLLLIAFVAHAAERFGVVIVGPDDPYWVKFFGDLAPGGRQNNFLAAAAIWITVLLVTNVMAWRAVHEPIPQKIQQAVKTCIVALVGVDAAVVALVCGPLWAAAVLLLLIPTLTLGRWVYST